MNFDQLFIQILPEEMCGVQEMRKRLSVGCFPI